MELLEVCYNSRSKKKSSKATWHPVFGWFQEKSEQRYMDAMPNILRQMQLLWKKEFLSFLFAPLFAVTPAKDDRPVQTATMSRFQRFRLLLSNLSSSHRLPPDVEKRILDTCSYFQLSMKCLPDSKMDLLTGIICHGDVIPKLWCFLGTLTKLTAEEVCKAIGDPKSAQILHAIRLFCQVTCHLMAILDDKEFYEKEEPFKLADLVQLSQLLNQIAFSLIWKVSKSEKRDDVLTDCLLLLHVLYDRDNRRPFCPDGFWLIKDLRFSSFMSEFKNGKDRAKELLSNLPHIIPHRQRVELFRERVQADKKSLGIVARGDLPCPSTYIRIRRGRLLEDGHDELAALTAKSLKSTIKVKFVNEQGLDEAGIDEHGVFKEFLEDIITKAFNPDLNLFKLSNEERLYPSPTSHVNPNHLSYFEFMGKLLGKAVYEGIVLDIPFASFFLRQVLGHHHRTLYSPYDELPSMDSDLYRSLQSIKNYEGDVRDLELTFIWDVEHVGRVITHELKDSGSAIQVTNDNRISYIHLVAQFHLFTQIKQQSAAFVNGFRSIIPREWTACFSAVELQRLISGDDTELDVDDLKRNTVYYGGYHSSHRVISWLWDILKNDFKKEEKALFLKFVTSCSRPPLLGFNHLEPKFTIRFVQVGDDEDHGDTVFSVMRGFLSVGGKKSEARLPTASTCFNLLKLPNYSKKAVLRDKLRYAIHANAGFELS
jgi:ubiquitin-protein ligase E3 B